MVGVGLLLLHAHAVSGRRLLVFGAILFVSCRGALPHPPYSAQPASALAAVEVGPPPGRVEVIPPPPAGADAWIDGEWIVRHGRWYWLLGRWVKTPPGATYSPWVLVRSSDGTPWYARGTWRDSHGANLQPPPPLAVATASGESVVDPEGEPEDTGRSLKTAPPSPPPTPEDAASPPQAQ